MPGKSSEFCSLCPDQADPWNKLGNLIHLHWFLLCWHTIFLFSLLSCFYRSYLMSLYWRCFKLTSDFGFALKQTLSAPVQVLLMREYDQQWSAKFDFHAEVWICAAQDVWCMHTLQWLLCNCRDCALSGVSTLNLPMIYSVFQMLTLIELLSTSDLVTLQLFFFHSPVFYFPYFFSDIAEVTTDADSGCISAVFSTCNKDKLVDKQAMTRLGMGRGKGAL